MSTHALDSDAHRAANAELVSRLEAAGGALAGAQLEARDYLEGVTRVLTEAHGSFAENVEQLKARIAELERQLAAR